MTEKPDEIYAFYEMDLAPLVCKTFSLPLHHWVVDLPNGPAIPSHAFELGLSSPFICIGIDPLLRFASSHEKHSIETYTPLSRITVISYTK